MYYVGNILSLTLIWIFDLSFFNRKLISIRPFQVNNRMFVWDGCLFLSAKCRQLSIKSSQSKSRRWARRICAYILSDLQVRCIIFSCLSRDLFPLIFQRHSKRAWRENRGKRVFRSDERVKLSQTPFSLFSLHLSSLYFSFVQRKWHEIYNDNKCWVNCRDVRKHRKKTRLSLNKYEFKMFYVLTRNKRYFRSVESSMKRKQGIVFHDSVYIIIMLWLVSKYRILFETRCFFSNARFEFLLYVYLI